MNECAMPNETKFEVRLTQKEIDLLKECLKERNDMLQRNLHQELVVHMHIENDKNFHCDDDFKEWHKKRLSAQYEEQAMIAHIENAFKNAKEESVSIVHCNYDLYYAVKKPQGSWRSIPMRNVPIDLNDKEFENDDYTVRFEACLNRPGYAILITRR